MNAVASYRFVIGHCFSEKPRNAKLNAVELAAYALVANTLLNLDEAIMQN